ncbi:hypothetical protein ACHAXT_005577 [Thalassiosira profunda]
MEGLEETLADLAVCKSECSRMSCVMAGDSAQPETVKFNVGGKHFEVARSLIDEHSETMLSRLVSTTWLEDPTKPVFIDRDGDTFAHVLNYLRYGSISLPVTVHKDNFLRDLDFYGVVPDADSPVRSCSEAWSAQIAERCAKIKDLEAARSKLEAEINTLQMENDIDILANYCASEYLRRTLHPIFPLARQNTHSTTWIRIGRPNSNGNDPDEANKEKLWSTSYAVCNQEQHRENFRKSISRFGLRLHVATSSNGQVKLSLGSL